MIYYYYFFYFQVIFKITKLELTFFGVRNRLPDTIPLPSVMNFTLTFTNWVSNISGSSGMDAFLTGSFLLNLAGSGGFLGSGGGIFNNWPGNTNPDDNLLCCFNLNDYF